MYFSIIDFLLWLFTMSCIIHISMAVCSTMIQSIIVLSTCHKHFVAVMWSKMKN